MHRMQCISPENWRCDSEMRREKGQGCASRGIERGGGGGNYTLDGS